jgi:mono/diheme cytochrome c family protein
MKRDVPFLVSVGSRRLWLAVLPLLLVGAGVPVRAADKTAQAVEENHAERRARGLALFKKEVRGILEKRCLACHGGDDVMGGFNLATREGLLRGGESGQAVESGKGTASRLYKLITRAEQPYMPYEEDKLPDAEIARIAEWIDLGAPYDRPLVESVAEASDWRERDVPESARAFWSFQPLTRVEPPAVRNEAWCRNEIDRFILARLEAAGLAPNPEADRRTLIRRAYFAAIGLPPAPEAVDAFIASDDPRAHEQLAERLLANEHFGERWARHWLDVARFAESHGFEQDYDRPHAYHYRDFVIRAFNADMPYDQFVRWQLAGDEFAPDEPLAMMATGFLGAGVFPTQITANEVERTRYDALDDMAATTGTAFLGLTIGCARCHDHKFDPLPQADYYRFISTFTTTVRSNIELDLKPEETRAALTGWERENGSLTAALAQAVERLERDAAPASLLHPLRGVLFGCLVRKPRPKLTPVMVASEGFTPIRHHTQGADFFEETYFLKRGDCDQKDGIAEPGVLQVLMRHPDGTDHWRVEPPEGWRTSYRRRSLANWMTDTDHGPGHLLARVIVNRLWHHHFGRGLVATPNDFGAQGEPPSHPQLLDWLAAQLIENGWRLKPIHKLIMTSAAYRQSSEFDEAKSQADPLNALVWRYAPRRLEAEIIRDALLAVSGTLDRTMYGPGTLDEGHVRRSIYFTIKRSKLIPMLVIFDTPEPLVSVGRRPTTTIAPQALLFLNNEHVRAWTKNFAARLAPAAERSLERAVTEGYRIALGRRPTKAESFETVAFLERQQASYEAVGHGKPQDLALADFCQVLMSLSELIYVD